jgi:ABC-type microcin C transport system permease subunit YejB
MHRYIVKRLLLAIPTLAGAAALVFMSIRHPWKPAASSSASTSR